jgi:hypothetical protein
MNHTASSQTGTSGDQLITQCFIEHTSQQSVPFDLRVYSTRLLRMICSILAELLAYFQDQRFDPPELCRVPRRK